MAEKCLQWRCRVRSQNVGEARCQSKKYYAESVVGRGHQKYYAEYIVGGQKYYAEIIMK